MTIDEIYRIYPIEHLILLRREADARIEYFSSKQMGDGLNSDEKTELDAWLFVRNRVKSVIAQKEGIQPS